MLPTPRVTMITGSNVMAAFYNQGCHTLIIDTLDGDRLSMLIPPSVLNMIVTHFDLVPAGERCFEDQTGEPWFFTAFRKRPRHITTYAMTA